MSDRPTHVTEHPSDDRTRCGIKIKTKAALPYVSARFVHAHIDGRAKAQRPPILWCHDCVEGLDVYETFIKNHVERHSDG